MTSVASPDSGTSHLPLGVLHAVRPGDGEPDGEATTWGWAVVEIRNDGSWGHPQVVPADEAAATAPAPPVAARIRELSPAIQAHVGSLHVSNGFLTQAVTALTRGTRARASLPARHECLGRLAHVEAFRGDLRRASRHAGVLATSPSNAVGAGAEHAQLAGAWIAFERADFVGTRRRLDRAVRSLQPESDPWLAASRLLIEARLLVATGQPDAATRLLAGASELALVFRTSGWLSDLVTIARAEALLASGEPQRALALVTPLPARAAVEASVVAAAARRGIGDVRGAEAVLAKAVPGLESAPLPWQIQAWLLESRLAEDRGKHERARLVLDRALRLASAEQLRRPLVHDWRWVRAFVDRDPALQRSHRDFLSTCHFDEAAPSRRRHPVVASDQLMGAPLTEREGQVLDLLAQMYSTDEIAAALYVSSNTVKTHLKGIFGKLCVNRRVEAVRRGRQLGLC